MTSDWSALMREVIATMREMRGGAPDLMKAFNELAQTALKGEALDPKTKELIAVGISVAIRCDDCIAFHAKAAVDHGATPEELYETLGMAVYLGAGPSMMYATHAFEAYKEFAERKKAKDASAPPQS